jgi:hypothetical protein
LELLDDVELAALTSFIETQTGAAFTFVDPASGAMVPNCSLIPVSPLIGATAESNCYADLVIEEAA